MSSALMREVARVGLAEKEAEAEALTLPVDEGWDVLWGEVRNERAVPLLAASVRRGSVRCSHRQEDLIRAAHEESMRTCVRLERVALEEIDRLQRGGVECLLLKGAASAHLDYADPALRSFGDVDLLVPSSHYDRAVSILRAGGAHRRSDEARPGFDRRFGKGVCMIRRDGVQVDLHRTFASGPFAMTVDADALFSSRDAVILGDTSVPTLDVDHRFLHACFHAALGDFPPRLTSLREVAQLLLGGRVDLARVRTVADRWRAGVVVASAITASWTTLRLPRSTSVDWAFEYVPSRFERRALAAYIGDRRSYGRQMIAAIPAVRGWRARAVLVSSLLFADRSYVERRDRHYVVRARRAFGSLAAGASR
jgi:hypothetical protein